MVLDSTHQLESKFKPNKSLYLMNRSTSKSAVSQTGATRARPSPALKV